MHRTLCAAVLTLVSAAGCAGDGGRRDDGATADSVRTVALEVYQAQYCGTCHALAAAGTAGTFGPGHDSMRVVAGRRLADPAYTGRATTAASYILESLTDPGVYRVPGFERTRFLMPAYAHLDPSQLDALVQLLMEQPTSERRRP